MQHMRHSFSGKGDRHSHCVATTKSILQPLSLLLLQELESVRKGIAEVIDFEEFVKECPKTLRTNLVKLAKENGHDLGFLS